MSAGCRAVVPRRRPLPDGRRRGSTSSAFGLVTVSGCAPYAAVNVPQPSFPGCRLASMEQSATSRHVCKVTACFLQLSEDSSLQPQFSLTILLCLRSDALHYRHINRCSYLLTYLLTLFGEIRQTTRPLCYSRSFNVTDFCTNRKPICDFLLVINSNLPPILCRFQVMADYWSNFRYRCRGASL